MSLSLSNPQHIAIIMDGNGRWAKKRFLPRTAGHKKGVDAVQRVIESSIKAQVPYLTLFGFSTENWKRPEDEVSDLMGLLKFYLRSHVADLHKEGVCIRFIGDRGRLSGDIVQAMSNAEEATKENTRLTLIIALSYGARAEIAHACRQVLQDVQAGKLAPEEINEDHIAEGLYTAGLPDPDLVIRTSGEKRVSNFLLWQLAYAEFIFQDVLWPDYGEEHFNAALSEYKQRDRRYGAVKT